MRELLVFAVAGAGTYFMRSIFIVRGDRTTLPGLIEQGLKYVGPAVLSSLIAVSIAQGTGIMGIITPRPETVGMVVCVAVAWWRKNVVLTVVVGLAVVWFLQGVLG
jgi:branched-subunit amino acid transport protein